MKKFLLACTAGSLLLSSIGFAAEDSSTESTEKQKSDASVSLIESQAPQAQSSADQSAPSPTMNQAANPNGQDGSSSSADQAANQGQGDNADYD